jgi:hypothetical protein
LEEISLPKKGKKQKCNFKIFTKDNTYISQSKNIENFNTNHSSTTRKVLENVGQAGT